MDPAAPQPAFLGPGAVLGEYCLRAELGRGGFGVVWEAEDTRDGSRVAVKTLLADLSDEAGQRAYARFTVEIDAVRRIRHPNVVAMHGTGSARQQDGRALSYYAMELIHGQTLDKVVRTHGALEALMAAQILQQAATGLHTAHVHGVVHRDVKPENIMLASDARVVVMDFGICKVKEAGNLTVQGTVVGTTRYLSPEQFLGGEVGPSADVFALGAVLFFLVTGGHLRMHKDIAALFRAVVANEDLHRIEGLAVPEVLKRVLRSALAPAPEQRFPSAAAMADALGEACLVMQGLSPLPPAPPAAPLPPPPAAPPPDDAGALWETRDILPAAAPPPAARGEAGAPGNAALAADLFDGVTGTMRTAATPLSPALFACAAAPAPAAEAPSPFPADVFDGPQEAPLAADLVDVPGDPAPEALPQPVAPPAAAAIPTPCDYCGCLFPSEQQAEAHTASCVMRGWHERNFSPGPAPQQAEVPPPAPPPAPAAAPPRPAPRRPRDHLAELDDLYVQAVALGGELAAAVVKGLESVAAMSTLLEQGSGAAGVLEHVRPRLVEGARRMLRAAQTAKAHQDRLAGVPPSAQVERQVRELAADPRGADERRRREAQLQDVRNTEAAVRTLKSQLRGAAEAFAQVRPRLEQLLESPEAQSPRLLGIRVGELMAPLDALLDHAGRGPL